MMRNFLGIATLFSLGLLVSMKIMAAPGMNFDEVEDDEVGADTLMALSKFLKSTNKRSRTITKLQFCAFSLAYDCFERIKPEMLEEADSFFVKAAGPHICVVYFPPNVEINFQDLNFASNETFARVLVGHEMDKVAHLFDPIYAHNGTEDHGPFLAKCPFSFVAFWPEGFPRHESIQFSLTPIPGPIDWAEACPPPRT